MEDIRTRLERLYEEQDVVVVEMESERLLVPSSPVVKKVEVFEPSEREVFLIEEELKNIEGWIDPLPCITAVYETQYSAKVRRIRISQGLPV